MLKALTTASIKSKRLIRTWTYQTLTLMLQLRLQFIPSTPRVRMSYLPTMLLATERLLKLKIIPVTLMCKRRTSTIPLFSSRFFFFFFLRSLENNVNPPIVCTFKLYPSFMACETFPFYGLLNIYSFYFLSI